MTQYLSQIEHFVGLQKQLFVEFIHAYPEADDFKFLVNFPRSGELTVSGKNWRFVKHGAGVRFIRKAPSPKIVVEMHDNFGTYTYVDAWRLMLYLKSIGIRSDRYDLERAIISYNEAHQL
jgi:hypothetical protein